MASNNYEDGTWDREKVKAVLQKHPIFLKHDMQIHEPKGKEEGTSFTNLVRGARLLDYYNSDSNTSEPDPIDYNMFTVNPYLKPMLRNAGKSYNERNKVKMVATLSQWDKDNRPRLAAFATHVDPRPSTKHSKTLKAPPQAAQAQSTRRNKTASSTSKTRKTPTFKDNNNAKRQKKAKVDETDDEDDELDYEIDMQDENLGSDQEVVPKPTRAGRVSSQANTDKQADPHTASAAAHQTSVANPSQDIIATRTRSRVTKRKTPEPKSIVPFKSMAKEGSKLVRTDGTGGSQVDLTGAGMSGKADWKTTSTRPSKKVRLKLNIGNLRPTTEKEQDAQQEDLLELSDGSPSKEAEGADGLQRTEDPNEPDEDEQHPVVAPRSGGPLSMARPKRIKLQRPTHFIVSEIYSETEEEEARIPINSLSMDGYLKRMKKIRQRNGEPELEPGKMLDYDASQRRRAVKYARLGKAVRKAVKERREARERKEKEQEARPREEHNH